MSSIKVIVTDDDVTLRALIVKSIESLNYTVIQCSDGKRAWETLLDNPDVKLLVTDMQMDTMDGRELTKRIRENAKFKSLPIIVISGVVGIREIDDLLKLGVSRFMPKPLRISELKEYVQKLVERYSTETTKAPLSAQQETSIEASSTL